MAKANDKARPPITERFVTVQEIWGFPKNMSVRPKTFYSYMKIGGMWLVNDAGFEPGEKVRIAIEPGRLVITAM
ncbi:SymE family type I addiction module toxin [Burkholderia vietnamiensis]|uniref:SymE family type I addiction module toxin n=1 Tax=Burkholderia vietnamiensis TaxID=60552 RepID=UPI00158FEB9C|nr:SymE family type I addiction module toxin [Burkholderia vietnamiensis]